MALKHALGDIPMVRVLDFMLEHLDTDYTTKEIAEYADVAPSAVKRDFDKIIGCGMVTETRKIRGARLYTLNTDDPVTDAMIDFDSALSDHLSEKIAVEEEDPEIDDSDADVILAEHNSYHQADEEEEWDTGDDNEIADLSPG